MLLQIAVPAVLMLVFGAWRVTDGGFHRLPLSTFIGWALPMGVMLAAVNVPIWSAVIIGLVLGRVLTKGYKDWNSPVDMLWRPVEIYLLVALAAHWPEANHKFLVLAFLSAIMANLPQPLIRNHLPFLKGNWKNRAAEFWEGAWMGLATYMFTL